MVRNCEEGPPTTTSARSPVRACDTRALTCADRVIVRLRYDGRGRRAALYAGKGPIRAVGRALGLGRYLGSSLVR